MKASKLIWHKTDGGRNIPGVIPALLFAGFFCYVTFMLVSRSPEAPQTPKNPSRVQIKDIADITTTVTKEREPQSTPQEESISTRKTFEGISSNLGLRAKEEERIVSRNSINTVMQSLMSDGDVKHEQRRLIDDEPLMPAYVEERELLPTSGTILDDEKESTDIQIVGFTRKAPPSTVDTQEKLTGFQTDRFLPRGYQIPIVLLSRFETGDLDSLVEFAVLKDVKFKNTVMLERGTRILAVGAQSPVRERITFSANTILYPDGRELQIRGIVKDSDGSTGLIGEYVKPPIGVDVAGYSSPIINALASLATNTEEKTEVIASDGTTVTQQNTEAKEYDAQNAVVDAVQEIAQQRAADQLTDYIERNSAYVQVKQGQTGYVILTSAVDLTNAAIGGSALPAEAMSEIKEEVQKAVVSFYEYGSVGGLSSSQATPSGITRPRTNTQIDIPGLK